MWVRVVDRGRERFDHERGLERNREVEPQNKKPRDVKTRIERERQKFREKMRERE